MLIPNLYGRSDEAVPPGRSRLFGRGENLRTESEGHSGLQLQEAVKEPEETKPDAEGRAGARFAQRGHAVR